MPVEELTRTLTLLTLIRDVYPISFITIIHGTFGYVMGIYKYRMEIRILETEIERLGRQLEREH